MNRRTHIFVRGAALGAASICWIAVALAPFDPSRNSGEPFRLAGRVSDPGLLAASFAGSVAVKNQTPGSSDLVLVGIAGRLPDNAEVLVRAPWGKTTPMRIGDSMLGWKLVAIEAERASFQQGTERMVLTLPALP